MKYIDWDKQYVNQIVNLWNKEIGTDFPMREALFLQNSFDDKNVSYEASKLVLNKEEKVVAFIVVKDYQEKEIVDMHGQTGWIQALLVDTDYRNQGIGTKLLKIAESYFEDLDKKQILIGRDPFHYFPGVPTQYEAVCRWLETKGYAKDATEVDLVQTYKDDDPIEMPSFEEAEFVEATKADADDLIAFLKRCFPGRWEYEAKKYFASGENGREFTLLKVNGEVKGFCRMNDPQSKIIAQNVYWDPLFTDGLGGVGPLGVDSSERGKGYGLAIVQAAIAFLRQRGVKNIVIDWTGLIEFYEKLGYSVWKTYEPYTKKR
ncbi:MAG TPA: GNAT family N-acetyltransferase [Pseudogracilibacillus sp.]|nr:GNAT family N-acetyltransferase [Pseudogracilibacillus sp.]